MQVMKHTSEIQNRGISDPTKSTDGHNDTH